MREVRPLGTVGLPGSISELFEGPERTDCPLESVTSSRNIRVMSAEARRVTMPSRPSWSLRVNLCRRGGGGRCKFMIASDKRVAEESKTYHIVTRLEHELHGFLLTDVDAP